MTILKENGLEHVAKDTRLMNHYGFLFNREHPVIFEKNIKEFRNNLKEENPNKWIKSNKLEDNPHLLQNSNIFEAIQSTNWNNMRFKPSKTLNGKNSWLIEFRTIEMPITSKEKYYIMYFTTVMQRIVTDPKIYTNFYIPISLTDKNILTCIKRDAAIKGKFFFKKHFYGEKANDKKYKPKSRNRADIKVKRELFIKNEIRLFSIEELMLGGEDHQGFKGLIELFIELNKDFLAEESKRISEDIVGSIWKSFDFFLKRCQGKLVTSAALMRNFVLSHPDYKQDSVVEGSVADDLIAFIMKVQNDNHHKDLFGNDM
jgi:glutamate--cysteine ligase catalytic subunit